MRIGDVVLLKTQAPCHWSRNYHKIDVLVGKPQGVGMTPNLLAPLAQLVLERRPVTAEASGSNPLWSARSGVGRLAH